MNYNTGPWTPADDKVMRADYVKLGPAAVARKLGRKPGSVRTRAWFMELTAFPRWTAPEEAKLIKLVNAGTDPKEIAKKIKSKTLRQIYTKTATLRRHGLVKASTNAKYRFFTKKDDTFILKQYRKLGCNEAARKLGRSTSSVQKRAKKLGVA